MEKEFEMKMNFISAMAGVMADVIINVNDDNKRKEMLAKLEDLQKIVINFNKEVA